MNSDTLEYRAAAVQSATPVQLVCMLYDTVVRDLTRALDAIESQSVETRAFEVKHALLVLDQLQAFLDPVNGGETAAALSRFYANARARIMEGHGKVDPTIFQEQIRLLLDVRSAWEKVDPARTGARGTPQGQQDQARPSFSCSV